MTTSTIPFFTRRRGLFAQLGVDSLYLLTAFPLHLIAFVLLITGFAMGAGLAITLIGLPILVVVLHAAGVFAAIERLRLRAVLGEPVPDPPPLPEDRGGWFSPLRDQQRWVELGYALASFPVATVNWALTLVWWTSALGGLTYWMWAWAIPGNRTETWPGILFGLVGPVWDIVINLAIGLFAAVTLPLVTRGLAATQAGFGRLLLSGERGDLQRRVAHLTQTRQAAASAEAQARTRLERDLHDGPQQRLLRLAMDLSAAERKLGEDPDGARTLLNAAIDEAGETLQELRALSRGVAPAILTDRGLSAALTSVAARSTLPVTVDSALADGERLPAPIEQAVYHIVAEALANVAKHSGATKAEVVLRRENGWLTVQVHDNGGGGAHPAKGHGLAGLADRIAGQDGALRVDSPAGGPTTLTATLPCA
jgi:signal transduction histidine kinase